MYESRFTVFPGDVLALISDGVVYAGVGSILNFGWTWESVAEWLRKESLRKIRAPAGGGLVSGGKELYMDKPGDDSTVMVARNFSAPSSQYVAGRRKTRMTTRKWSGTS